MLSEKIGKESGKVTGRRVLRGDADYRFVRMEITHLGLIRSGFSLSTVVRLSR